MSWQSLVDDLILGTNQVSRAAILGRDGTRYAASRGFVVQPGEVTALVNAILVDPSPLYTDGVLLARVTYKHFRTDPGRAVYCRRGREGAVAVITGRCLLVGGYTEGMQEGCCASVMEKLADYFITQGY